MDPSGPYHDNTPATAIHFMSTAVKMSHLIATHRVIGTTNNTSEHVDMWAVVVHDQGSLKGHQWLTMHAGTLRLNLPSENYNSPSFYIWYVCTRLVIL